MLHQLFIVFQYKHGLHLGGGSIVALSNYKSIAITTMAIKTFSMTIAMYSITQCLTCIVIDQPGRLIDQLCWLTGRAGMIVQFASLSLLVLFGCFVK